MVACSLQTKKSGGRSTPPTALDAGTKGQGPHVQGRHGAGISRGQD